MVRAIRTLGHSSKKKRRTELCYNPTKAEEMVWSKLKGKAFNGLKFRCQHGIGPFIVDFYFPETMSIIEIDGSIHDDEEVKEYDESREHYFLKRGYNIIRFRNEEVFDNLNLVLQKILSHIDNLRKFPNSERSSEFPLSRG